MDTIYALASAPGKSGVAVIRVSGENADDACLALAGSLPEPRVATLKHLKDSSGGHLDEALIIRFAEGASFTGESIVEFHVHGSVAVVAAVLGALGSMEGLRLANPGEFTRRALENGRLELTQVEALSDLIESETEAQRVQALRMLSGALGARVVSWRKDLVRAAALLEATIDFADEDVPVDVTVEVDGLLKRVRSEISIELAGFGAAERVRTGYVVAIVGPPNAGKSTLLNALAGRDAAITSEIAGTTRDVIEVRMDIAGMAVTLLDTAGLRETSDPLELAGIERAKSRSDQADIRIFLGQDFNESLLKSDRNDIVLVPKDDQGQYPNGISGVTGAGIEGLIAQLTEVLVKVPEQAGLVNRERHREALTSGLVHLDASLQLLIDGPDSYDLASEELRLAVHRLLRLVGQVDVEDLLGEIFANFCVGK